MEGSDPRPQLEETEVGEYSQYYCTLTQIKVFGKSTHEAIRNNSEVDTELKLKDESNKIKKATRPRVKPHMTKQMQARISLANRKSRNAAKIKRKLKEESMTLARNQDFLGSNTLKDDSSTAEPKQNINSGKIDYSGPSTQWESIIDEFNTIN